MGMIKGVIKREGLDLSEARMLDASGDDQDNQGGDVGSRGTGVSLEGSMRVESLMPVGGWSDRRDGEGGDGSWCWGMVQWGGPGGSRELEWMQLHCVSQSGLSGDDAPDNYWWLNLA